jgi:hypothetical protein
LIAISEINYTKHCTDRNYVHKHALCGPRRLRRHLVSLFTTAQADTRFGLDRHSGRNPRLWS